MLLHQRLFLVLILLLPLQLGKHFWLDFSYVMGLRVDYLSPTIYLTDLLVLAILGLWAIEKISNIKNQTSKIDIKNLKLFFFLFLIFIFLLVNCFFARNQGAAFYKLLKILEFFALGFYAAKNYCLLFTIHWPLVIAVVYSSLLAIAQFVRQSSLNGIFWWLGERTFNAATPGIAKIEINGRLLMRPYATFSHPNALAGFVLVSFIFTLPFVFKKSKTFAVVYSLLVISCLALTFSRSVWLVGLLVAFWFLKSFSPNYSLLTGYCLLIALIVLLIKLPNFAEESLVQRMELNKISLQLIKQSPLTGVGLNNFVVRISEFWRQPVLWLQPVHNIYLLVAAETGVVGLLIFLYFLLLTYKKIKKFPTPYKSIFLYVLISILLLGFFDHYWLTLQQNQLLLTILLGLIWIDKTNKIKNT